MRPQSNSYKQASQDGFALPITIALGLIAILIGLTSVLRAEDDRNISQNNTGALDNALVAEAGVLQVQNFISRYSQIALIPNCDVKHADNSSNDEDGSGNRIYTAGGDRSCQTATGETSWQNPQDANSTDSRDYSYLDALNLNCAVPDDSLSASREVVKSWTNNSKKYAWIPLDKSDPSQGEYRMVQYEAGAGAGVLWVEGRKGQGNGSSLIKADFPVDSNRNDLFPRLWVKDSIAQNPSFDSDIMASCDSSVDALLTTGRSLIRTQEDMPNAQPAPSSPSLFTQFASVTDIPETGGVRKLPLRGTHTPDSEGVYKYIVDSIDESLEIDVRPGEQVHMWVKGDIDLSNLSVTHVCETSSSEDCADPLNPFTPFNFRIYSFDSNESTLTLNSGTLACDTFFHLPNYNVVFNAGGTTPVSNCLSSDSKNITSIFWVKSWSGRDGSKVLSEAVEGTWQQGVDATGIAPPAPTIGAVRKFEPVCDLSTDEDLTGSSSCG